MKRTLQFVLLFSALCFSALLAGAEPDLGLISRWQQAIGPETISVSPLDSDKLPIAVSLFGDTLRACEKGEDLSALNQKWQEFGYGLHPLRAEDADRHVEAIWILAETTPHALDEGFFAFRIGQANAPHLLLQAPHSMGDFKTGEIVVKMFVEGSATAACWSTSPRVTVCGTSCSDLTHRSNSLFQAMTIAFACVYPESRIAQIHGFSPSDRVTPPGRNAGVIVASGLGEPTVTTSLVATELAEEEWKAEVRIYGSNVFELGAIKNAQKESLVGLHYPGFVHLEFSPENRELLFGSAALRSKLEDSILATKSAEAEVESVARR